MLGARFRFELVAVETAGTWRESAVALISEIGRVTTEVTRESRKILCLEERLSLAVQRGNVLRILTAIREIYIKMGVN